MYVYIITEQITIGYVLKIHTKLKYFYDLIMFDTSLVYFNIRFANNHSATHFIFLNNEYFLLWNCLVSSLIIMLVLTLLFFYHYYFYPLAINLIFYSSSSSTITVCSLVPLLEVSRVGYTRAWGSSFLAALTRWSLVFPGELYSMAYALLSINRFDRLILLLLTTIYRLV